MMMITMVTTTPATTSPLPEEESSLLADVGITGILVDEIVVTPVVGLLSTDGLMDDIAVSLLLVTRNTNKEIHYRQ